MVKGMFKKPSHSLFVCCNMLNRVTSQRRPFSATPGPIFAIPHKTNLLLYSPYYA